MRTFIKLCPFMLAAMILYIAGITSFAQHDVPDNSILGSVTVTMIDTDSQRAVSGGTLTLYKAGEIAEDNGDYSFALTEDFSPGGLSLDNLEEDVSALAQQLADYARTASLKGAEQAVGEDGKVLFSGLEPGLYLAVQNQAADGYYSVRPFLVSVPMAEEGAYLYDVNASPKVELKKEPDKEKEPDEPSSGSSTPSGDTPSGTPKISVLPQTGLLNWPVPVMAAGGLVLFAIGWGLCYTKKGRRYER